MSSLLGGIMNRFLYFLIYTASLFQCIDLNPHSDSPNSGDIFPPVTPRKPLFEPTNNSKILIMGQDLISIGGMSSIDPVFDTGYMDDASLPIPSGFTTYTSLVNQYNLTHVNNDQAGPKCANYLVNHPHPTFKDNPPVIAIGLYMIGVDSSTAEGKLDDRIESLGEWIKNCGCPVLLRIGYEFDAEWNGYDPLAYRNAFRRIVSKFEQQKVKNCAYVWQSDGYQDSEGNKKWYPGDDYVDWIGYSHFTADGAWMLEFAREKNKPVLIAEATPNYYDIVKDNNIDEWEQWFAPLFKYIESHKDVIKGLAYINAQWYSQPMWQNNDYFKNCDSRVEKAEESFKVKWRKEFAENNWFSGSDALEFLRGWEPDMRIR